MPGHGPDRTDSTLSATFGSRTGGKQLRTTSLRNEGKSERRPSAAFEYDMDVARMVTQDTWSRLYQGVAQDVCPAARTTFAADYLEATQRCEAFTWVQRGRSASDDSLAQSPAVEVEEQNVFVQHCRYVVEESFDLLVSDVQEAFYSETPPEESRLRSDLVPPTSIIRKAQRHPVQEDDEDALLQQHAVPEFSVVSMDGIFFHSSRHPSFAARYVRASAVLTSALGSNGSLGLHAGSPYAIPMCCSFLHKGVPILATALAPFKHTEQQIAESEATEESQKFRLALFRRISHIFFFGGAQEDNLMERYSWDLTIALGIDGYIYVVPYTQYAGEDQRSSLSEYLATPGSSAEGPAGSRGVGVVPLRPDLLNTLVPVTPAVEGEVAPHDPSHVGYIKHLAKVILTKILSVEVFGGGLFAASDDPSVPDSPHIRIRDDTFGFRTTVEKYGCFIEELIAGEPKLSERGDASLEYFLTLIVSKVEFLAKGLQNDSGGLLTPEALSATFHREGIPLRYVSVLYIILFKSFVGLAPPRRASQDSSNQTSQVSSLNTSFRDVLRGISEDEESLQMLGTVRDLIVTTMEALVVEMAARSMKCIAPLFIAGQHYSNPVSSFLFSDRHPPDDPEAASLLSALEGERAGDLSHVGRLTHERDERLHSAYNYLFNLLIGSGDAWGGVCNVIKKKYSVPPKVDLPSMSKHLRRGLAKRLCEVLGVSLQNGQVADTMSGHRPRHAKKYKLLTPGIVAKMYPFLPTDPSQILHTAVRIGKGVGVPLLERTMREAILLRFFSNPLPSMSISATTPSSMKNAPVILRAHDFFLNDLAALQDAYSAEFSENTVGATEHTLSQYFIVRCCSTYRNVLEVRVRRQQERDHALVQPAGHSIKGMTTEELQGLAQRAKALLDNALEKMAALPKNAGNEALLFTLHASCTLLRANLTLGDNGYTSGGLRYSSEYAAVGCTGGVPATCQLIPDPSETTFLVETAEAAVPQGTTRGLPSVPAEAVRGLLPGLLEVSNAAEDKNSLFSPCFPSSLSPHGVKGEHPKAQIIAASSLRSDLSGEFILLSDWYLGHGYEVLGETEAAVVHAEKAVQLCRDRIDALDHFAAETKALQAVSAYIADLAQRRQSRRRSRNTDLGGSLGGSVMLNSLPRMGVIGVPAATFDLAPAVSSATLLSSPAVITPAQVDLATAVVHLISLLLPSRAFDRTAEVISEHLPILKDVYGEASQAYASLLLTLGVCHYHAGKSGGGASVAAAEAAFEEVIKIGPELPAGAPGEPGAVVAAYLGKGAVALLRGRCGAAREAFAAAEAEASGDSGGATCARDVARCKEAILLGERAGEDVIPQKDATEEADPTLQTTEAKGLLEMEEEVVDDEENENTAVSGPQKEQCKEGEPEQGCEEEEKKKKEIEENPEGLQHDIDHPTLQDEKQITEPEPQRKVEEEGTTPQQPAATEEDGTEGQPGGPPPPPPPSGTDGADPAPSGVPGTGREATPPEEGIDAIVQDTPLNASREVEGQERIESTGDSPGTPVEAGEAERGVEEEKRDVGEEGDVVSSVPQAVVPSPEEGGGGCPMVLEFFVAPVIEDPVMQLNQVGGGADAPLFDPSPVQSPHVKEAAPPQYDFDVCITHHDGAEEKVVEVGKGGGGDEGRAKAVVVRVFAGYAHRLGLGFVRHGNKQYVFLCYVVVTELLLFFVSLHHHPTHRHTSVRLYYKGLALSQGIDIKHVAALRLQHFWRVRVERFRCVFPLPPSPLLSLLPERLRGIILSHDHTQRVAVTQRAGRTA